MNKQIQQTKENNQILGDVIAIKIKQELNHKQTFAQDLIDSVEVNIK